MLRQAALASVVALGLARDPGCGSDGSAEGVVNAPCTRSKDCSAGLVCVEGVCRDPNAPPAADASADGAPDAADAGDSD